MITSTRNFLLTLATAFWPLVVIIRTNAHFTYRAVGVVPKKNVASTTHAFLGFYIVLVHEYYMSRCSLSKSPTCLCHGQILDVRDVWS